MKASKVLRKARKLIKREEHWIKSDIGFGRLRGVDAVHQECGCAMGACIAVASVTGDWAIPAIEYLNLDAQHYGYINLMKANDDPATTHKQVLRAFDRAIKAAEAAGE